MDMKLVYGLICYHVLTRNDPHPSYLLEKMDAIQEGEEAFARLDVFNMGYAMGYCSKWNIAIPTSWYEASQHQINALNKLRSTQENKDVTSGNQ